MIDSKIKKCIIWVIHCRGYGGYGAKEKILGVHFFISLRSLKSSNFQRHSQTHKRTNISTLQQIKAQASFRGQRNYASRLASRRTIAKRTKGDGSAAAKWMGCKERTIWSRYARFYSAPRQKKLDRSSPPPGDLAPVPV